MLDDSLPQEDSQVLDGSALVTQPEQTPATQAQEAAAAPAAATAVDTLEDDLTTLLEESGVRTQSSPSKSIFPTQSSPPHTAPDQTVGGDEEQFWEAAVLEGADAAASPTRPQGSSPEIPATQATGSQESTLESWLEQQMDESFA